jgi:tRNA threonylcarbamoyladenosine biosynthesis protein TsaB
MRAIMGGPDNDGLLAAPVKLLAFDTSTETLSVALSGGADAVVREYTAAGGPQASAELIPAVERLLAQAGLALAQLDAIVFGRGPGSFTGLRTAAAVAQGLGFGAAVPVLPVDTLLAVAEEARALSGATQVVALLDARMDEVYFAGYELGAHGWIPRQAPTLGKPEAVQVPAGWTLAGNAVELHAARLADAPRVSCLPTARALLRLAPALLADHAPHPAAQALPLYIRDKVAQTTEERAADRARKEALRGASVVEPR